MAMPNRQPDFVAGFRVGVENYFRDFGHRQAKERSHQAWLLISLSRLVDPQLLVAELNVPNQDLRPFANISPSDGAVSFDFAITRTEVDLRTWKTRNPGWKSGVETLPRTLETLQEVAVLAEFKVAASQSTSTKALIADFEKLKGAIGFLRRHGCDSLLHCFLVVLDPQRTLDVDFALDSIAPTWPETAPLPTVLSGPEVRCESGSN